MVWLKLFFFFFNLIYFNLFGTNSQWQTPCPAYCKGDNIRKKPQQSHNQYTILTIKIMSLYPGMSRELTLKPTFDTFQYKKSENQMVFILLSTTGNIWKQPLTLGCNSSRQQTATSLLIYPCMLKKDSHKLRENNSCHCTNSFFIIIKGPPADWLLNEYSHPLQWHLSEDNAFWLQTCYIYGIALWDTFALFLISNHSLVYRHTTEETMACMSCVVHTRHMVYTCYYFFVWILCLSACLVAS